MNFFTCFSITLVFIDSFGETLSKIVSSLIGRKEKKHCQCSLKLVSQGHMWLSGGVSSAKLTIREPKESYWVDLRSQ
jgi:hypothetical protein